MSSFFSKLDRLVLRITFSAICFLGRRLHIRYVISYLRNPRPELTIELLKTFGAKIGDRTAIKGSISLDNVFEDQDSAGDFSRLEIGSNCYIGDEVYFDLANTIQIESNCVVSGRVAFLTHADCNRSAKLSLAFPRRCAAVKLHQGAWVGFGTILLSGSEIGAHTLVAACSLVRGVLESEAFYAGIPAIKRRSLGQDDSGHAEQDILTECGSLETSQTPSLQRRYFP